MFNLFKKKKVEPAPAKTAEELAAEHEYRMEHDAEYRISMEKSRAFFKADREAREKAGLTNLPGEYFFNCPNCGTLCKGGGTALHGMDNLHGHTGCQTCNIHLMV